MLRELEETCGFDAAGSEYGSVVAHCESRVECLGFVMKGWDMKKGSGSRTFS